MPTKSDPWRDAAYEQWYARGKDIERDRKPGRVFPRDLTFILMGYGIFMFVLGFGAAVAVMALL